MKDPVLDSLRKAENSLRKAERWATIALVLACIGFAMQVVAMIVRALQ